VDVKCTCGCGDCFNGGFATGLHLGLSPKECVQLAQASSAQNATGLGSQAGVKDLAATLAFIQSTPTFKMQDLTFGKSAMALS
jgi:sugar/nucleoside kinase (ribokinase family)